MNILVLTHEYPPIGGGGGKVAQDLCQGLVKRGHHLSVLTALFENLPEKSNEYGIQIIRVKSGRKEAYRADFKDMLGFIWSSFWVGLRQIREIKPDLIHAHFAVPSGVSAFMLHLFTKTPYVLTAHLGDVPGGVPEKTGKWFKWIFPLTPPIWRKAAKISAVSVFTRSLALKHYHVPIEVIPNGVDLTALDPGVIEVNNPPKIVFAGRFMPQKNPLQLIRCLAELKDLPWSCTLIGDGPMYQEIEKEIHKLQIQDRIQFTGWITPEQVINAYRTADIMFMPSLSEGLPVVGVQALAMGLALVLSRVGGSVELIEHGINGFLFEPHDKDGFVLALRELISNPQKLLAYRLASRKLAEKFSLDSIIMQYEQLFSRAIAENKTRQKTTSKHSL